MAIYSIDALVCKCIFKKICKTGFKPCIKLDF